MTSSVPKSVFATLPQTHPRVPFSISQSPCVSAPFYLATHVMTCSEKISDRTAVSGMQGTYVRCERSSIKRPHAWIRLGQPPRPSRTRRVVRPGLEGWSEVPSEVGLGWPLDKPPRSLRGRQIVNLCIESVSGMSSHRIDHPFSPS